VLWELAVFAAIRGAIDNSLAARLGHLSFRCARLFQRQSRLGLHQVEKLADSQVLVQFGAFGFVDRAFVVPVEQLTDLFVGLVIEMQVQDGLRELGRMPG